MIVRVADIRPGGDTVLAYGAFDPLMPGHMRYLLAAAELGHPLVVAVYSDLATRKRFGVVRTSLRGRLEIVDGIRGVNLVVPVGENGFCTLGEAISQIRPMVLAVQDGKGGQIEEWDLCRSLRCEIMLGVGLSPEIPPKAFGMVEVEGCLQK